MHIPLDAIPLRKTVKKNLMVHSVKSCREIYVGYNAFAVRIDHLIIEHTQQQYIVAAASLWPKSCLSV